MPWSLDHEIFSMSTLLRNEAQKLVCFIEIELCAAHIMCLVKVRTAENSFLGCALLSLVQQGPESSQEIHFVSQ